MKLVIIPRGCDLINWVFMSRDNKQSANNYVAIARWSHLRSIVIESCRSIKAPSTMRRGTGIEPQQCLHFGRVSAVGGLILQYWVIY